MLPHNHRRIATAKGKVVSQECIELNLLTRCDDIGVITCLVQVIEIDGWGDEIVLHHQKRGDEFQGAGSAYGVTDLTFHGCDHGGILSKNLLDGRNL